MNVSDRLYEQLTPVARFRAAMEALGRGDVPEIGRLYDTASWHTLRGFEPAFCGRMDALATIGLKIALRFRAAEQCFLLLHIDDLSAELDIEGLEGDGNDASADGAAGNRVVALTRALHSGWLRFCSEIGVRPEDVDVLIGQPVMGWLGTLGTEQDDGVRADEALEARVLKELRDDWARQVEKFRVSDHAGVN